MTVRDTILTRLRETLRQPHLPFPPAHSEGLTHAERMTVTSASGDIWAQAQRFQQELHTVKGSCELLETVTEARLAVVSRMQLWLEEEQAARKTEDAERPRRLGRFSAGRSTSYRSKACPSSSRNSASNWSNRATSTTLSSAIPSVASAPASPPPKPPSPAPAPSSSAAAAPTHAAASLTPFRHLVVIPFSKLFATGEDWLAQMRHAGRLDTYLRQSRNLSIITGPSKSADLEGNLTMGVHGPKVVHAILFDDLQQ